MSDVRAAGLPGPGIERGIDDATRILLARYYTGRAAAREGARWAEGQLARTRDTECITLLAQLPADASGRTAIDLVNGALAELGWAQPGRTEILRWYGRRAACRMLARCRAPGSVLRQQIENVLDVCDELGYTLEGSRWAALAREFDCCIRGITEEEWKLEVMKEAHALLDTYFADHDLAPTSTNAPPRN